MVCPPSPGRCRFVYWPRVRRTPYGVCAGAGVCKYGGGRAYLNSDDADCWDNEVF